MLDLKFIRENSEMVKTGVAQKGVTVDLKTLLAKDKLRRELLHELDNLRSHKNQANEVISQMIQAQQDPQEKIASMKEIASRIGTLDAQVKSLTKEIHDTVIAIPNVPHSSVPVGGVENNQIIRTWGQPRVFDFKPKTHIELVEALDIVDFKRATKITGSHFILYKNAGARLERALFNFMLDVHTDQHGYTEVFPPFVVNTASMVGTGQLPKMADDMYKVQEEDLYLIPTAEVPITNIYRDEVLKENQLPIYHTGYTACFRREAGSYGKDTRGLIRVHQFDKVEMVKFVPPENSYDELDGLVEHAQKILELLELPYRVLLLATGDLSFAAAKCFDLEAHAGGIDTWLEVSSCSNFEDFQARRANIRFKGPSLKKPTFVHTLNGSGLALARTMIAIVENYQTAKGEVVIPEVLRPYMGGLVKITP